MKRKQIAVLLVVALFLVPTSALAAVRGSPDLDVTTSDGTVIAGEDRQLTLVLSNSGNLQIGSTTNPSLNSKVTTARGVKVTLERNGAPVTIDTGTQTLGSLPEGKTAQLPYQISVTEDAKPGTYEMEAEVEYTYTPYIAESQGEYSSTTTTKDFDVEVTVEDRARFEIVDTSTDVRVGSTGTVDVTMENVGTEAANDTTVSLTSQNSDITFGKSSQASRYVGAWRPGETRTISYQAQAAPTAEQQQYAFTATAGFEDSDGTPRESQPLSLGVTPQPEQQFSVVDTSSTVAVGDTGTLRVTLENTGNIAVNDATVTIESTSSDVVFGKAAKTTGFVGNWAPGEQRTVEVDVTATDDADTRSYALRATVDYDDEDDDAGTSRPISLGLTPEPETGFALSDVTNTLRVGEEGVIRGTVTNQGQTTVRDAVLQFATENQNVNPSEREYSVGNLAPGESADFEFTVEINEGAEAGPRQFSFVTEYRNQEGETRKSDDLLTRQDVGEKKDAFDVQVEKGAVSNGGSAQLQVTVTNQVNETLTDISAKLFTDDPISASDSEAFVEELAPGESKTINFTIGASGASPKAYPVSVDFQYDDSDGDTLVSDTYRLPVSVSERQGGGGGLPLTVLGIGAALVVGIGGYMRFRN